jgi:hypothetical protein
MCPEEPPIMNFGALFVYLSLCPLMKGGGHVKPFFRASINHSFMSPYLEFWSPDCMSVYMPFYEQSGPWETILIQLS